MDKELNVIDENINPIFETIRNLINDSRNKVYSVVNTEMLNLYWDIGKIIMEIQQGDERATYGDAVLEKLSEKLTNEFGKGFSERNLERMRKFYICFPISTTVSSKLSWSHYLELIKIDEETKRNFYLQETINSRWSVRELQRQKDSLLYERLALSKDKEKVLELAQKGQILREGKDLIKDPFVLEFLDIKENTKYLETDLEKNILEHLKEFLLELGKGFMFVGSQVRITMEEDHFYPDLVFYNRLLKCFVIIDLKIGKITHQDIGQMQMYVNYYDRDVKNADENKTVGILLSTQKNTTVVKYTLPEENSSIFASEYRLHLPTEKELIEAVEEEKKNLELNENKIINKIDIKNVFLIHGYNGIPKIYEWLESKLKKMGYNVITPKFEPREGVIYENWKKTFDNYKKYINDESIIVAHSIGNEFIIKYFNENNLSAKLYISLAGFSEYFEWQDKEDLNRACKEFLVNKEELENFRDRCSKKYSIYSNNDHIVPFEILQAYPKTIEATPVLIENIGHMGKKSGLEEIPKVIELIEENEKI